MVFYIFMYWIIFVTCKKFHLIFTLWSMTKFSNDTHIAYAGDDLFFIICSWEKIFCTSLSNARRIQDFIQCNEISRRISMHIHSAPSRDNQFKCVWHDTSFMHPYTLASSISYHNFILRCKFRIGKQYSTRETCNEVSINKVWHFILHSAYMHVYIWKYVTLRVKINGNYERRIQLTLFLLAHCRYKLLHWKYVYRGTWNVFSNSVLQSDENL